ncbi:MAG: MarR family transcriptional regulator [Bacteriovoracaceae bacterium]|nr:MarR family transcriptional regulator [Bacteriovoracaceae bacterium]
MKKISQIGALLKKSYRIYGQQMLQGLTERGFSDLRPSFLEVLRCLCEHHGPTIKELGTILGLKKQTMTSHLHELEASGYIRRQVGEDRREQKIYLTEYGERFKLNLLEVTEQIEQNFRVAVGEVELDRVETLLSNFYGKLQTFDQQDQVGDRFF